MEGTFKQIAQEVIQKELCEILMYKHAQEQVAPAFLP